MALAPFILAPFAGLLVSLATVSHAAIFDDGNDRKLVKDLRAQDPSTLTPEERAILVAAAKVGSIGFCGGKTGGNGFLVRFRGRDAVITNAHMLMDKHGNLSCDIRDMSARNASIYMPNTSFYDADKPEKDSSFLFRKVQLIWPPLNWEEIKGGYQDFEHDFAIFYLLEQISTDRLPAGDERGALRFSTTPIENGSRSLFMVGLAKDLGRGKELTYQEHCLMSEQGPTFYHGCDTLKGSSASLLATYENRELAFRGLHTSGTEDVALAAEKLVIVPNVGTSSEHISRFMDDYASDPNSQLLNYELQWLLAHAGCYAGGLDNQWGPGSQGALQSFAAAAGIKLQGAEPTADVLAAVERVAPDGTTVCQ